MRFTFYTNVQKLSHLLSPTYHSHQIHIQCTSMKKHFIHKKYKNLGTLLRHSMQIKMYIKNIQNHSVQTTAASPIHVPGVYCCQKYAPASHQVPENQKSIQLLLFNRKYTLCYQHSTKERLYYGPQSFETCTIWPI